MYIYHDGFGHECDEFGGFNHHHLFPYGDDIGGGDDGVYCVYHDCDYESNVGDDRYDCD